MADENFSTDEWHVNLPRVSRFDVPSFIRLFAIKRIIDGYVSSDTNHESKINSIKSVVTMLNDEKTQNTACTILTRLINDGIKIYMSDWYDEKEQAAVIEEIFKNIILVKFGKEFQQLTTYVSSTSQNKSDDHDEVFKSQVFNTDDLMCCVFQYLTYKRGFLGDLFHCSLVSSYFLYHIWNTNLIYGQYNLTYFINQTLRFTKKINAKIKLRKSKNNENDNYNNYDYYSKHKNGVLRAWQRLMCLKQIAIYLFNHDAAPNGFILERLSMLRNIESIKIRCNAEHERLVKVIIEQCQDKILQCDIGIRSYRDPNFNRSLTTPSLPPLHLPNATDITINNLYFYLKWSNMCQILRLSSLNETFKGYNDKWCDFVIKNCDCTGVKYLLLDKIGFTLSKNKDTNYNKGILSKFAQKFIDIQCIHFVIDFVKMNHDSNTNTILVLLKCFHPIIVKNGGGIQLTLTNSCSSSDFYTLTQTIEQLKVSKLDVNKVKNSNENQTAVAGRTAAISKIELQLNSSWTARSLAKLLHSCHKNLKWLSIVCGQAHNTSAIRDQILNYLMLVFVGSVEKKFALLNVIKFDDYYATMGSIGFLVRMVLNAHNYNSYRRDNRMFVIANCSVRWCDCKYDLNGFDVLFKTICQNIYLLLKNQIPIDIKIEFRVLDDRYSVNFKQSYSKIFESYFNQVKLFKEFQEATCNEFCVALKYPQVSFVHVSEDSVLRVVSAKCVDSVCIM